ncbi:MAG: outer membrane protein assembly factor BamE [Alphaproteobacteria bacterium]|nr:outer membrane protein assembly factor BamE [Alphaproteobacteria bacterium]
MSPSTGASLRRFGRLRPSAFGTRGRGAVIGVMLIGALLVSACEPAIQVHGHMPDDAAFSRITLGATSRDEVVQLMGSPTSVATFDDRRWYYITRKTETGAFDQTDILEQQVVMVEFDEGGFVSAVEKQDGLEQVQEVALVDRVTPTKGRELGFFEQILGNFGGGRLTKKGQQQGPTDTTSPTSRRRY